MPALARDPETLWSSVPGVDAAARLDAECRLRTAAHLAPRPDGEVGLFAVAPIPAGAVLVHRWHDHYYLGMPGWQALTVAEIDALPPAHRALFHRYGLDADLGLIFGPATADDVHTLDNFINHACDPSLGYDALGSVIARRDLRPGDELTIDYGWFVANYDEPFTCACGAPTCRGRVTRDDWRSSDAQLPPYLARRR